MRKTFAELQFKPGVLIGGIIRGQQVITPGGSDYMLPGDRVIVITTTAGLNELRDILR